MLSLCLTSAIEYREDSTRSAIESQLAAMASGDTGAIAGFYEHTKAAIYGFSLSILKNRQDAEDVMQDVYLRIFQAASQYRPNGNPMPWVLTITKNLALMHLRKQKKTTGLTEEQWDLIPAESPSVTAEDRLLLSLAMGFLGEEERQIIMLHAVAGFKHREIADILDLALPTVLSKYHRAIKKLQKKFQESEENAE